jgi:hypothetical protein
MDAREEMEIHADCAIGSIEDLAEYVGKGVECWV